VLLDWAQKAQPLEESLQYLGLSSATMLLPVSLNCFKQFMSSASSQWNPAKSRHQILLANSDADRGAFAKCPVALVTQLDLECSPPNHRKWLSFRAKAALLLSFIRPCLY